MSFTQWAYGPRMPVQLSVLELESELEPLEDEPLDDELPELEPQPLEDDPLEDEPLELEPQPPEELEPP